MANDSNLVWAKQKYSCFWPARVSHHNNHNQNNIEMKINIIFFVTSLDC